jgi:GNAT superfamily N-acetyltransferase
MGVVLKSPDYTITAAAPGHVEELPHIELAAASRFRGYDVPLALFADATPLAVLAEAQASGHLWVALERSGGCVGFALVEPSGARLHLHELDVLPDHGGRGVGRALVRQVERWAGAHGFAEVTLTTYRDVPWNGPLYGRLGYESVPPEHLDVELAARLESEAAHGLDSMPRVAMRKRVRAELQTCDAKTRGAIPT